MTDMNKITSVYASLDLTDITAYVRSDDGASYAQPIDTQTFSPEQQAALAAALAGLAEQIPEGETIEGSIIIEPVRNAVVTATEEQEIDGQTVEVPTAWEDDYSVRVHTVDGSTPARHRTRNVTVSEESRRFIGAIVSLMEAQP